MKLSIRLSLFLFATLFIMSCEKTPKANFTIDNELSIYEPVVFDYSGTNADSYLWDFGDGSTGAVENPSHQYDTPGDYTVNLTASNAKGSDSFNKTIAVRSITEGEYSILSLTLLQPIIVTPYQLIGPYTPTGGGGAINVVTGASVGAIMNMNANVTVDDYLLTLRLVGMQFTDAGSIIIPDQVVDTKGMTSSKSGATYTLTNDDFTFQLIKK